jgi:hypothetical protein
MITQQRIVQTGAVPPNTTKPLESGATNIYDSTIIKQNNQAQLQTSLAQNGGIRRLNKKRKYHSMKGGDTPVVIVSSAPSFAVDKDTTNANNIAIATIANNAKSAAALDGTTSQAQVAGIVAQQQSQYKGTGGNPRRRKLTKRGGSLSVWGCLSGGKKTRRYKKSCMCKIRKHRKTKRHRH